MPAMPTRSIYNFSRSYLLL